jgi:predicted GTPase
MGSIIYAGVDYEAILREAEKEADIIVWDGGNNDIPFFKSDLEIVVVDPHRAGHELKYYPGETNLLRAHVIIVNKVDTADQKGLEMLLHNILTHNPGAVTIQARSPIFVTHPEKIRDKKVLVVEDGPTLTHGEMKFGAGIIAARKYKAREIIDPRPYVTGTLTGTYKKYPYIGTLLPAMGYGVKQMKDLEQVINKTPCDLVVIGTPIDLSKYIHIKKEHVRVTYELEEKGKPDLGTVLEAFVQAHTPMLCAT